MDAFGCEGKSSNSKYLSNLKEELTRTIAHIEHSIIKPLDIVEVEGEELDDLLSQPDVPSEDGNFDPPPKYHPSLTLV